MKLRRLTEMDDFAQLLKLIQTEFTYMETRIDPPSSMHSLTGVTIRQQAVSGEIWVIEVESRPVACVFLTPKPDALYIGKLAVSALHRNKGLARDLVEHASIRALALGFEFLELQTRIELCENHAAFARMGFAKTAATAHEGYDRPTSITMRRSVKPQ